jgi:DDRGK domain
MKYGLSTVYFFQNSQIPYHTMAIDTDSGIGVVGLSDRILVGISIVGFTTLVYFLHSIVLARGGNVDGDDDDGLSENERLVRADVTTLNRAQRRARAKAIMKDQRRAQQPPTPTNGEHANDRDENVNDNVAVVETNRIPRLTRKEREQHAKVAEKEERRRFQEQREGEQKQALLEAQHKKKERMLAATQRQLDDEQQKASEGTARIERERNLWYTFISSFLGNNLPLMTVSEFLDKCQTDRIVDVETIATTYGVTPGYVVDRIATLMSQGRIAGFFQENRFVYVSDDELRSIASVTRERRSVSLEQFTTICQQIIVERR